MKNPDRWWSHCQVDAGQIPHTASVSFTLIFLLSPVWGSLSSDPRPGDCEPRPCGDGGNISYPFRIRDEQPSYCGYPLACNRDGVPVLDAGSGPYLVRDIFYHNRSLIISSAELSSNACPYPAGPPSLPSTALFRVSSVNRELFFHLNCTDIRESDLKVIDCANNMKGRVSLFAGSSPWVGKGNESLPCESSFIYPFLARDASSDTDLGSLVRNGFLVEWIDPDCSICDSSGGRCGFNQAGNQFMCICSDRVHRVRCPDTEASKTKRIILGVTAAGASGFVIVGVVLYLWHSKKHLNLSWIKQSRNSHNIEAFLEQYGSAAPKRYKYVDVKKMTKSFTDELGEGGYGTVFKGKLPDGQLVAVKILDKTNESGEEFISEVASMIRTHHVNIVSLLGFCCEGSKRALIYEFMPNGSLEKFIFQGEPRDMTYLGWEKLLEIAVGIARGLEYLHRGCNNHIVHFDIKPHNILLDEDFCPKISDFGLAKSCRPKQSILSIVGTRGTIGYIAPEVFSRTFGAISSKSDVYSYGMMLLEMVGGRKNIEARTDNTSDIYFPHWIYEHLNEDGILGFCGITNETKEVVRKMTIVGLWCIQTSPSSRPSVGKVLEMLEGNIEDLQMPPKPYLCSPTSEINSCT